MRVKGRRTPSGLRPVEQGGLTEEDPGAAAPCGQEAGRTAQRTGVRAPQVAWQTWPRSYIHPNSLIGCSKRSQCHAPTGYGEVGTEGSSGSVDLQRRGGLLERRLVRLAVDTDRIQLAGDTWNMTPRGFVEGYRMPILTSHQSGSVRHSWLCFRDWPLDKNSPGDEVEFITFI